MAKNRVAPERAQKKTEHFVGKVKKTNLKQNVTGDKCLKPSASGSRTFFSESSEKQNAVSNVKLKPSPKPKDFFIKPSTKLEGPKNSREKSQSMKQNLNGDLDKSKKPFDKKKYRLQKYSKKFKLQQWEDRRKHAVLHEYYRQVKDDQPIDVSRIYEDPRNQDSEDDQIQGENQNNSEISITKTKEEPTPTKVKVKPFQRAQQEFQRIKEEKLKKKEDILKSKAEKQEAMKKYKKQKVEKYKKLSRRTKKGQPIMKDRIEMLLEKIQNSMK